MRAPGAWLLFLPLSLCAQQAPPRFLYIYRDSLRSGVDSAYRVIENDGAQACADLKCANPYVALESLTGSHEAWWINAFATEADTIRVATAYASNQPLLDALAAVARRKEGLIGKPVQGFAVYRPDLSGAPSWSLVGARFVVATVTLDGHRTDQAVWEAAGGTLYLLTTAKTRAEADAQARAGGRVFAVRPNWSMPAPEWAAADPEFWRAAPRPRRR